MDEILKEFFDESPFQSGFSNSFSKTKESIEKEMNDFKNLPKHLQHKSVEMMDLRFPFIKAMKDIGNHTFEYLLERMKKSDHHLRVLLIKAVHKLDEQEIDILITSSSFLDRVKQHFIKEEEIPFIGYLSLLCAKLKTKKREEFYKKIIEDKKFYRTFKRFVRMKIDPELKKSSILISRDKIWTTQSTPGKMFCGSFPIAIKMLSAHLEECLEEQKKKKSNYREEQKKKKLFEEQKKKKLFEEQKKKKSDCLEEQEKKRIIEKLKKAYSEIYTSFRFLILKYEQSSKPKDEESTFDPLIIHNIKTLKRRILLLEYTLQLHDGLSEERNCFHISRLKEMWRYEIFQFLFLFLRLGSKQEREDSNVCELLLLFFTNFSCVKYLTKKKELKKKVLREIKKLKIVYEKDSHRDLFHFVKFIDLVVKGWIEEENHKQTIKCTTCSKNGAQRVCSRCRKRRYCSVECQKKDWKKHKHECGVRKPEEYSSSRKEYAFDSIIKSSLTETLMLKYMSSLFKEAEPSNYCSSVIIIPFMKYPFDCYITQIDKYDSSGASKWLSSILEGYYDQTDPKLKTDCIENSKYLEHISESVRFYNDKNNGYNNDRLIVVLVRKMFRVTIVSLEKERVEDIMKYVATFEKKIEAKRLLEGMNNLFGDFTERIQNLKKLVERYELEKGKI